MAAMQAIFVSLFVALALLSTKAEGFYRFRRASSSRGVRVSSSADAEDDIASKVLGLDQTLNAVFYEKFIPQAYACMCSNISSYCMPNGVCVFHLLPAAADRSDLFVQKPLTFINGLPLACAKQQVEDYAVSCGQGQLYCSVLKKFLLRSDT
jgi:hypothetical protein